MFCRNRGRVLQRGIAAFLLLVLMGSSTAFAGDAVSSSATVTDEVEKLDELGTVNLEGIDDKSNEILEVVEESEGVVLFGQDGDEQSPVASSTNAENTTVNVKYSRIIQYEKTATHYFTVVCNGETKISYCVQPKKTAMSKGKHDATFYDSELMAKALYYSYGYPGFEAMTRGYLAGKSRKKCYKDNDGFYVVSHLMLSYIYDKKNAFVGTGSAIQKIVKDMVTQVATWPAPPRNVSLALSDGDISAGWDTDEKRQKTGEITLSGTEGNYIDIAVPSGGTIIKNGEETTSGSVRMTVGDRFSFAAPAGVSGTYSSPFMTGSAIAFQPYLIHVEKKQDQVFGYSETCGISFVIRWLDFGNLEITKVSTEPKITEGNSNYSLEGAEYGIYFKSNDKELGKIVTDGAGHGLLENVPYGEYFIMELKAPKGYELDEEKHDISVSTSQQIETLQEKPVLQKTEETTEIKQEPEKPKVEENVPETGDDKMLMLLLAGIAVSMLFGTAAIVSKCDGDD